MKQESTKTIKEIIPKFRILAKIKTKIFQNLNLIEYPKSQ